MQLKYFETSNQVRTKIVLNFSVANNSRITEMQTALIDAKLVYWLIVNYQLIKINLID